MKKILLLLFVVSISYLSHAQLEGCDGLRYIDDVFTNIKVTKGIKYGEGETISGNFQELFLDVYEPENDVLARRPVIILAFGGSFIGGERGDLEFLCEGYARKGYVAVTIDYRLYDGPFLPLPTGEQFKNVVIKSVSDMKAAIRYMRQDADIDNLYRINPDKVFVGGISAGSITAFHAAAIDEGDNFPQDIQDILDANGGLEGNSSDNFEYSSEVQGLVNFSGGLNDASWIDENDPPFVSVHDDMDGVVPYGTGFAKVLGIPIVAMDGSKRCQEVGDNVGVMNQLKTIENSMGHVSYLLNPMEQKENIDYTAAFIADIVCSDTPTNVDNTANALDLVTVYPNPTNGSINISEYSNIDLTFKVLDLYGRKLNHSSQGSIFDMSNYSNGIYFIEIMDKKSNAVKTVKVILEK